MPSGRPSVNTDESSTPRRRASAKRRCSAQRPNSITTAAGTSPSSSTARNSSTKSGTHLRRLVFLMGSWPLHFPAPTIWCKSRQYSRLPDELALLPSRRLQSSTKRIIAFLQRLGVPSPGVGDALKFSASLLRLRALMAPGSEIHSILLSLGRRSSKVSTKAGSREYVFSPRLRSTPREFILVLENSSAEKSSPESTDQV